MGIEGQTIVSGARLPRDIDALQEAFVQAHELERRMPGEGRWPFAGDGPWNLIQAEVGDVASDADYSETLIRNASGKELQVRKLDSRAPRPPLDAGEVAEYQRVVGWLQLIEDPADRRVVWLATARLAAGEGRVPWTAVKRWIGSERSPDALVLRYRKAMALVVCRLNGWPTRRAKAMAA